MSTTITNIGYTVCNITTLHYQHKSPKFNPNGSFVSLYSLLRFQYSQYVNLSLLLRKCKVSTFQAKYLYIKYQLWNWERYGDDWKWFRILNFTASSQVWIWIWICGNAHLEPFWKRFKIGKRQVRWYLDHTVLVHNEDYLCLPVCIKITSKI